MLTLIKHVLHGISKRLKQVNSSYSLFWNTVLARYEVHNSITPSARTLAFTVQNSELDERVLTHAQRTQIHNADALEAEFDAHNRELESTARKTVQQQEALLADMMQFASSREHEVVFEKRGTWI